MAVTNFAPSVSTFDLSPSRRPGKADFNGIAKIDSPGREPDPQTMPNSPEWNLIEFLLLSMGRVCPSAIVSVTGTSNPQVNGFTAAPGAVTLGTFTLARASAGNVLVSWSSGTFPTYDTRPYGALNAGPGMIHFVPEGDGVRVYTYDQTGTPADLSFTLVLT